MKSCSSVITVLLYLAFSATRPAFAKQCGRQAGGALCPNNLYHPSCGKNCQSQCGGSTPVTLSTPTPSIGDVGSIITRSLLDNRCPAHGF
ncbi:26 kDa endochitinase 1 [Morus notabilis]|uniref:26 kDa endochitinase 1 n=1 Tax=Morus notabilis TaxID=981085 RepID=W9SCQ0_9ROSA|nr:26 kDa endochitinase 1 [Morus notabilis]